MQPKGHYAATVMGKKKAISFDYDFTFDYEQERGFQATFEKSHSCVLKKLWVPLGTSLSPPSLAKISGSGIDVSCQGFAASRPARLREEIYKDSGPKYPMMTGKTGCDDALLPRFSDEAHRHDELLSLHARPRHRRGQEVCVLDAEELGRDTPLLHRRHVRQLRDCQYQARSGQ